MHLLNAVVRRLHGKVQGRRNRRETREYTPEEALEILEAFSPDPHTSCYAPHAPKLPRRFDVSVIVPVYNCEKFLNRCLDSIVTQKGSCRVQLIVVNDGSTDASGKILETYRALPGVTILTQPNRGLSGARNAGLDRVEGEYILFVDADDRIPQGCIQKLWETARSQQADMVCGGYISVTGSGRPLRERAQYPDGPADPYQGINGYPWGKLYRAEIFEKVRFPLGYWFEDSIGPHILWHLAGKVYTVSDIVYEYTINPQGISQLSTTRPKAIDSLYITRALLEDQGRFGMTLGTADLKYFLDMVHLTYQRTSLCPAQIARCIFTVQCSLYRRYTGISLDYRRELQQALSQGDYLTYLKLVS